MVELNPQCLYDNGNFSGLLDKTLRTPNAAGLELIHALCQAIKDAATNDGTIANVVTYSNGLVTEFGTPATLNKVVAQF